MTAHECRQQATLCRQIAEVERERGRERGRGEETLAWARYARDWDELVATAERLEAGIESTSSPSA